MSHKRYAAMVLLGPTGSGKTPLGHVFAARGFLNRRCAHFDFGENLRDNGARLVRLEVTADMTADDMWVSLDEKIGTR